MPVSESEIKSAADRLGLIDSPVMVHTSLSSFGTVTGGAESVLSGLLDSNRTVLVPAFSSMYGVPKPSREKALRQNGTEPGFQGPYSGEIKVYSRESIEIDRDMGAIPGALLKRSNSVRGVHPLNSFASIGPLAHTLIDAQTGTDVYAPIRELAERGGSILLLGVGLDSMTALHAAEELAGRRLFVRWANGTDRKPINVAVGGCSRGFNTFAQTLSHVEVQERVGTCLWRLFPASEVLKLASDAIREQPSMTQCNRRACVRCTDAIAGGPY